MGRIDTQFLLLLRLLFVKETDVQKESYCFPKHALMMDCWKNCTPYHERSRVCGNEDVGHRYVMVEVTMLPGVVMQQPDVCTVS